MNPVAAYLTLHGFGLYTFANGAYRIKRGRRHHEPMLTLSRLNWGRVGPSTVLNEYEPVEWERLSIFPSMQEAEAIINADR